MSETKNQSHQSQVTLEDLLKLKRLERPSADFWADFEREMRQKQLSALVEKRAWWQRLPQLLLLPRVYIPLGATAAVAFTLVSLRVYSPVSVAQLEGIPLDSTQQSSREVVSKADGVHAISPVVVNRHDQADDSANRPVSVAQAEVLSVSSAPSVSAKQNIADEDSPSARSIAANFAHLEQSEPELISAVLGSRLSSPARIQSASQPTVELASLAVNNSKRVRLVAHYNDHQVAAEPVATENVRERLSRRWSDGEFNDRYSRIGLAGDKVSLKF